MSAIKKFRFEPLEEGSIFGKCYLDDKEVDGVMRYEIKRTGVDDLPIVTLEVPAIPSSAIYPCIADVEFVIPTVDEFERVIDKAIEADYVTKEGVARMLRKYSVN